MAGANGKVVVIEEVEENEYFHDRRIMVSIFMSLTNVHANWFPVDGTVKLSECFIGEHLGFIKFGSRVDTYLPPVTEILVGMNQSTTGNRTVIARLHPKSRV